MTCWDFCNYLISLLFTFSCSFSDWRLLRQHPPGYVGRYRGYHRCSSLHHALQGSHPVTFLLREGMRRRRFSVASTDRRDSFRPSRQATPRIPIPLRWGFREKINIDNPGYARTEFYQDRFQWRAGRRPRPPRKLWGHNKYLLKINECWVHSQ